MTTKGRRRGDTADWPPMPVSKDKPRRQTETEKSPMLTEDDVLGIIKGGDRRGDRRNVASARHSETHEGLPTIGVVGSLKVHIQTIFERHNLKPDKREAYENWIDEEIELIMKRRRKFKESHPESIIDEYTDEEYKERLTVYLLGKLDALVEQASEDERLNPFLLTGFGMEKRLRQKLKELNSPEETNKIIVLLAFDLDDFKIVNDLHGHATGDELLRSVGRAIDLVIRSSKDDVGAHYSGDEFGCMLEIDAPEKMSDEEIKKIVNRITSNMVKAMQLAIRRPSAVEGEVEDQEISTGYTIIRQGDQRDASTIKAQADEASNISKIIRIIEENRGNNTKSYERLVEADSIEQIKKEGGYTDEEIARAKFIWSQRRGAQAIAPNVPTQVIDRLNATHYQNLIETNKRHTA